MELDEPQLDEQVRAFVRREVALADLPAAALVTATVEHLHGEADPVLVDARAWPAVVEELGAHRAAQAHWPAVTDNDRLAAAFRTLNAVGIVARQNFTCCRNCGLSEIGAEVTDRENARGYAFYHHQDAERAAEGGDLWIAYGLFDEPPSAEIGEEVAVALRAEGLTVDWNGDAGQRIRVPMRWQRRRVGRLAALPAMVDDDPLVDVELLGRWTGVHSPVEGAQPASRLAGLYLPWLPASTRVRLLAGDASVTVRREGDTLVGEFDRPARPPLTAGRYEAMTLVGRLRGKPVPTGTIGRSESFLEVTYQHGSVSENRVALELPETLDLLRRLSPRSRDFLVCVGRSDGCVQMRWERDLLWLETPDPAAGSSTGRHVTVTEAERMVEILATEDRLAVDELGDLVTKPW